MSPSEPQPSSGLPRRLPPAYSVCMKRTNVMLDVELLEEATRLLGAKTWSATIQRALQEIVRRAKAGKIFELQGSGAWEGNLSEMRRDPAPTKRRKKA